jgi:ketosteroid isomerase-like protein
MKIISLLSIILLALGATAQEQEHSAVASLVEAERGFCKAAIANGIRDAFIANLADDAILFRPRAVAGKKWMIDQPPRPGLLTWEPIFADVSRAGDLGYTTGPSEFRRNGPGDKEVRYGNFVSVWKKQPDGKWKVVLDTGISTPPPTGKPTALQTPAAITKGEVKVDRVEVEPERAALMNRDREFSKSSATRGTVNAYDLYLSDDARVFRDQASPITGKQAARAMLSAQNATLTWQPAQADVSSAGDLGYTFGTAELRKTGSDRTELSNYVRIWKKQAGEWKVVLDIMNPLPQTAGSN